jgi:hypothetical protein
MGPGGFMWSGGGFADGGAASGRQRDDASLDTSKGIVVEPKER